MKKSKFHLMWEHQYIRIPTIELYEMFLEPLLKINPHYQKKKCRKKNNGIIKIIDELKNNKIELYNKKLLRELCYALFVLKTVYFDPKWIQEKISQFF